MSSNAIELIERFESMAWNYGINPERREKLAAALYEAVAAAFPKTWYEEQEDYKAEVLTNLSLLFGVPLGNLATPKATNSQPQLADNLSEEA